MNLIKNLFSRHPHGDQIPTTCTWAGRSGREYHYQVYPLSAIFKPLPGIYIYAEQLADGTWIPVYIAATRDLHQRLEGHVTAQAALADGATHIHAHYCTAGQSARCAEERDLLARWRPVCNEQFQN
jgi:hypothetical protein